MTTSLFICDEILSSWLEIDGKKELSNNTLFKYPNTKIQSLEEHIHYQDLSWTYSLIMFEGTIIDTGMTAYAWKSVFGSQEAGGSQPTA